MQSNLAAFFCILEVPWECKHYFGALGSEVSEGRLLWKTCCNGDISLRSSAELTCGLDAQAEATPEIREAQQRAKKLAETMAKAPAGWQGGPGQPFMPNGDINPLIKAAQEAAAGLSKQVPQVSPLAPPVCTSRRKCFGITLLGSVATSSALPTLHNSRCL